MLGMRIEPVSCDPPYLNKNFKRNIKYHQATTLFLILTHNNDNLKRVNTCLPLVLNRPVPLPHVLDRSVPLPLVLNRSTTACD